MYGIRHAIRAPESKTKLGQMHWGGVSQNWTKKRRERPSRRGWGRRKSTARRRDDCTGIVPIESRCFGGCRNHLRYASRQRSTVSSPIGLDGGWGQLTTAASKSQMASTALHNRVIHQTLAKPGSSSESPRCTSSALTLRGHCVLEGNRNRKRQICRPR